MEWSRKEWEEIEQSEKELNEVEER